MRAGESLFNRFEMACEGRMSDLVCAAGVSGDNLPLG